MQVLFSLLYKKANILKYLKFMYLSISISYQITSMHSEKKD